MHDYDHYCCCAGPARNNHADVCVEYDNAVIKPSILDLGSGHTKQAVFSLLVLLCFVLFLCVSVPALSLDLCLLCSLCLYVSLSLSLSLRLSLSVSLSVSRFLSLCFLFPTIIHTIV